MIVIGYRRKLSRAEESKVTIEEANAVVRPIHDRMPVIVAKCVEAEPFAAVDLQRSQQFPKLDGNRVCPGFFAHRTEGRLAGAVGCSGCSAGVARLASADGWSRI